MVTVGNSGAVWTGAGGLTLSRSWRPFRTAYLRFILIELRYSLHSDRYARAAARTSASFICGVRAKHVQRCRYNIQLSNRTGRLWWVTDQNKDGVWMRCHWRTFNYLSFFLFLYYAYSIILNDRLSNLFIFICCTFHCVNSKMLN